MPEPFPKLRKYAEEHGVPLYGAMVVLALVTVGILVVLFVPPWEVQHALKAARNDPALKNTPLLTDSAKQLELEDNFRKTIVQGLGGAIVLLGLYYSARTFGLSRQGHITDRFTKAIEQLGKVDGNNPNIEVRFGAIYALERIAIDSPRDHWTIMEVLTAYVRRNAPLDPDRRYIYGEEPRTDIQAILTVLGRRKTGPTRERPGQSLDLSSSRLCGANLFEANLQDAILPKANLQGAHLTNVDLRGANLEKANLGEARLYKANLQGANLAEANLQRVNLIETNLQGASLIKANLQGAMPLKANLRGANLMAANLQGANLMAANLQDASLVEANLQGANLMAANLQDALLDEALLTETNLQLIEGWFLGQIKSGRRWETALYSPDLREALGLLPEDTLESQVSSDPEPDVSPEND